MVPADSKHSRYRGVAEGKAMRVRFRVDLDLRQVQDWLDAHLLVGCCWLGASACARRTAIGILRDSHTA